MRAPERLHFTARLAELLDFTTTRLKNDDIEYIRSDVVEDMLKKAYRGVCLENQKEENRHDEIT